MTDKELFVATVADEIPRFEKIFKALPQDKSDYRPDPKARTAMELAGVIASEAKMFSVFLKTGALDFGTAPAASATTFAGLSDEMKSGLGDAQAIASTMADSDWSSEAKMIMDGKEAWKTTKGKFAIGFLLDLIHHRGQLSTYIRPMGGKVPVIYGPSADTNE
ncbi:MAG: hypothetical protein KGJ89_03480 [Patescibacteria group bacterium]|nr:hypothetical protein [Patescibacteria group bacterium]MDE2015392.1 hypothetical protein [Patescibacteria group bacterium]MDE2226993.1 hypothetical protein [Patescibacteria group bacterium]